MIIELFGPPGSGKTTFSHALASRLRLGGRVVDAHISARPGEERPPTTAGVGASWAQNLTDPLRRLARPFGELTAAIAAKAEERDSSTDVLVSYLPPGRVAALRMKQYLIRLSAAWREAQKSERIVIFDQGYVQAIASILLARERALEETVVSMLAVAPRSDLAIRVDAPLAAIESRLQRRAQSIGRLGRLFETQCRQPAKHVQAADLLYESLEETGRALLVVDSTDDQALNREVERAQSQIVNFRTRHSS